MGSGDQALAAGGTEGLLTQLADALPALVSYLDRDGRYVSIRRRPRGIWG